MCTTEVLDVQENVWKPGPTMTTCRANVAVAVVDDRIWAVGGFSGMFSKRLETEIFLSVHQIASPSYTLIST